MPDAILNGHKHHWEEAGGGEPLIMIHGATGSSKRLIAHMPGLSKHLRVMMVDLRGLGQSAHVPSLPRDWVKDVVALIEHLGLGSAHLYGSSLGSRVALRTAIDHPQVVRSLVLDHPIIAMEEGPNDDLNRRLNPANVSAERRESYRDEHGDDWEMVVRQYFEARNNPDFQNYLNLREPSKSVTTPTLVMRGDQPDVTHPLGHAFEAAQNIKGAWLWVRPNTDVRVMNAAPEETYALMTRFIAQVAGEHEPVARTAHIHAA
jgi:pimeloyl-ACP methyl ester carboxylesterase